ncbi:MAG: DUF6268 family outer membrane beta-barrel protein [bacterium]|nr:DUF6268 family outer membrane beta-barrel protein [bacterium]
MKKKNLLITVCSFFFCASLVRAQPFVDLINYNNQNFFSHYNDSSNSPVYIQDNLLNLFVPTKFKNDNVLIVRVNSEKATVNRSGPSPLKENLFSVSIPVGFMVVSPNKKWKYTGIFIPKLNSDLRDDLQHDFQYGGIALVTHVYSNNLQIKLGMYYNREFWGNFFLPLAGVDWKINDRFQMYGVMPSNFRFEYKVSKNWNTGVGWRSFQRSFRLSQTFNNDFIWVKENQVKAYIEGFVYKNLLLTFDVYRSVTYDLARHDYSDVNLQKSGLNTFAPFENNMGFTVGFAYRILNTLPQK